MGVSYSGIFVISLDSNSTIVVDHLPHGHTRKSFMRQATGLDFFARLDALLIS